MNRKLEWGLFLATSLYLLRYGLIPAWSEVHSDFPNYYVASRLLVEGRSIERIYDDPWFAEQIEYYGIDEAGKFSSFPLATAFVMLPLAGFEPLTAKRLWTLCNVGFLMLNLWLLTRLTGWTKLRCANLLLLCGMGLTNNFRLGQFYLVLTLTVLGAFELYRRNHRGWAGAVLALGIAVKYFPVVYLAGFVLFRQWRTVLCCGLALVGIACLEIGVFGWDLYRHFLFGIFMPHLDGVLQNQTPFSPHLQSWNSFFRLLFVYHEAYNPQPYFNWALGYGLGKWTVTLLCASLGVLGFCRLRHLPQACRFPLTMALLAMTALALLPASATYHFLLLTLPFVLYLRFLPPVRWQPLYWLLWGGYGLVGFLPYWRIRGLVSGPLAIVFDFPRLWLINGMFLAMIVLLFALVKPDSEAD